MVIFNFFSHFSFTIFIACSIMALYLKTSQFILLYSVFFFIKNTNIKKKSFPWNPLQYSQLYKNKKHPENIFNEKAQSRAFMYRNFLIILMDELPPYANYVSTPFKLSTTISFYLNVPCLHIYWLGQKREEILKAKRPRK